MNKDSSRSQYYLSREGEPLCLETILKNYN